MMRFDVVSDIALSIETVVQPILDELGPSVYFQRSLQGGEFGRPFSVIISLISRSRIDQDDYGIDVNINMQNASHYDTLQVRSSQYLYLIAGVYLSSGAPLLELDECTIRHDDANLAQRISDYVSSTLEAIESSRDEILEHMRHSLY